MMMMMMMMRLSARKEDLQHNPVLPHLEKCPLVCPYRTVALVAPRLSLEKVQDVRHALCKRGNACALGICTTIAAFEGTEMEMGEKGGVGGGGERMGRRKEGEVVVSEAIFLARCHKGGPSGTRGDATK